MSTCCATRPPQAGTTQDRHDAHERAAQATDERAQRERLERELPALLGDQRGGQCRRGEAQREPREHGSRVWVSDEPCQRGCKEHATAEKNHAQPQRERERRVVVKLRDAGLLHERVVKEHVDEQPEELDHGEGDGEQANSAALKKRE